MNNFTKNNSFLITSKTESTPPPAPVETFDYVYKILNLIYITNINNSIYNLDYDLGAITSITSINYYVYEKEKVYGWF